MAPFRDSFRDWRPERPPIATPAQEQHENPTFRRIYSPSFGVDEEAYYLRVNASWRAVFLAIGPESAWSRCIVEGGPNGTQILSRERPVILPYPCDLTIKPFATRGMNSDDFTLQWLQALEIFAFDRVITAFPTMRAPLELDASGCSIGTGAFTNLQGIICSEGRSRFSLYLSNQSANALSWYVEGLHPIKTGIRGFPISGTSASPNTLASGASEAYHLDCGTDRFTWICPYVKAATATTTAIEIRYEVSDVEG